MEARLDQARQRERAVETSRRELVARISHDLRTPLAAIRGMAEGLEDGVVIEPDTVGRYYRTLRVEADQLAGLVDDLFELSRINAGTLRLGSSRPALRTHLRRPRRRVGRGRAEADPAGREDGGPLSGSAAVDARELQGPSEPLGERHSAYANRRIGLGRGEPGRGSRLRDGGGPVRGIAEEDLDRVFEMAFRGQGARTPEPDSGGGLGLAIARGIAEAHHGELSVRNGPGCRFTLLLPLEQPT
jgi:signal transduction histidine kinase